MKLVHDFIGANQKRIFIHYYFIVFFVEMEGRMFEILFIFRKMV